MPALASYSMIYILLQLLTVSARVRVGKEIHKGFASMTLDELTNELMENNEDLFSSDSPSSIPSETELATTDRRDRDSEIPRAVGVGSSNSDYLGSLWNWVKGVAGYSVNTLLPYPLHSTNYLNQYVYGRAFDPSDSRDSNIAGDIIIKPQWGSDRPPTWKLWPSPSSVPYFFASNDTCIRATVTEALLRFEEATSSCVKFTEVTQADSNALVISSGVSGCFASLGYSEGNNVLTLGTGCINVGTVLHLLGHVLGMAHEDQRPNAREYVTVNTANIDVFGMSSSSNLDPTETSKYGYVFAPLSGTKTAWEKAIANQPYEFGSLMHNSRSIYSVDVATEFTLQGVKGPQFADLFGQRGWVTERDARILNEMYSCQRLPMKVVDRTFSRPLSPGITYDALNTCLVQDAEKFRGAYANES